jgi:DNA repair exonuclease SbcCD ATPase subunit
MGKRQNCILWQPCGNPAVPPELYSVAIQQYVQYSEALTAWQQSIASLIYITTVAISCTCQIIDVYYLQRKLLEGHSKLTQQLSAAIAEHQTELHRAQAARCYAEDCLQAAKQHDAEQRSHLCASHNKIQLLHQELNSKQQQAEAESLYYQQKLAQVTADVLAQANTIADQEGVADHLRCKLQSNGEELFEVQKQVSVVTASCHELKHQLQTALQEKTAAQDINYRLRTQIRNSKKMCQAAATCKQVAERDRDEALAQAKELESQVANQSKQVQGLKSSNQKAVKEKYEAQQQLISLKEKLASVKQQLHGCLQQSISHELRQGVVSVEQQAAFQQDKISSQAELEVKSQQTLESKTSHGQPCYAENQIAERVGFLLSLASVHKQYKAVVAERDQAIEQISCLQKTLKTGQLQLQSAIAEKNQIVKDFSSLEKIPAHLPPLGALRLALTADQTPGQVSCLQIAAQGSEGLCSAGAILGVHVDENHFTCSFSDQSEAPGANNSGSNTKGTALNPVQNSSAHLATKRCKARSHRGNCCAAKVAGAVCGAVLAVLCSLQVLKRHR